MKTKYLSLILTVVTLSATTAFSQSNCDDCDFVLGSSSRDQTFDGVQRGVEPGDRVCLEAGTRGRLDIRNVNGTEEQPITFINCGGKVVINSSQNWGIRTAGSSFIRITGTGSAEHFYGIELALSSGATMGITAEQLTTNIEIDHCEVHGPDFAGIVAKTDPRCDLSANRGNFVMRNVSIHDNLVYDTGTGEGLYIGFSFYGGWSSNGGCPGTVLYPHDIVDLHIYRNIIHHTGAEGMQVGCAVEGAKIYQNHISFAGQNPFGNFQDRGVQIGSGTGGDFYQNFISDVGTQGLIVQSLANNRIFNNVIVRTGGVLLGEGTGLTEPADGFQFYNNTIVDTADWAINVYASPPNVPQNTIKNNLIVNSGKTPAIRPFFSNTVIVQEANLILNSITEAGFNDPDNDDYSLRSDSVALNSGVDLSSIIGATDFSGTARSGSWDIGAYEYVEIPEEGQTPHLDFNDGNILSYLKYLPPEYWTTTDILPLIIYLHGAGERSSTGIPNLDLLDNTGLPQVLLTKDIPFIVISPQVRHTWNESRNSLNDFLDFLLEQNPRIDETRVYVTGISDGGKGVFDFPYYLRERVAAIVPVSTWPTDILNNPLPLDPFKASPPLPIWGFHGSTDSYTTMDTWIQQLNSAGGNAQFTLLTGGHTAAVWNTVYQGEVHDIYTWMLQFDNVDAQFPKWADWRIENDWFVNTDTVVTGTFMGWVHIEPAPWIYSFSLQGWFYIPESNVKKSSGWGYRPK